VDKHTSLRQHLVARATAAHQPTFQPSHDPTLVSFDRLFADVGVYSLDVNKHQPEDEFFAAYVLTADTVQRKIDPPVLFECYWSPVNTGQELTEGFLDGPNSALFGSTPNEALPPQELISAFLLLITSDFIHLSGSREQHPPLIRGAYELAGEEFGYSVLDSH
jgi:hypothetical protein